MFLGGIAFAVARLYRVDPRASAGVAAGLAAWAIHAGLDWDWEMPALSLLALLLGAAAIGWSEEGASAGNGTAGQSAGEPRAPATAVAAGGS
jgi:hypothetical protein